MGPPVHFQHVLHRAHVIRIVLLGQDPLLFQPGLKLVFLSTLRTASLLIASTISNSTNWSASSRKVQRARPWGAGPQAKAIKRASCSPSNFRGRWRLFGLRSKAAFSP